MWFLKNVKSQFRGPSLDLSSLVLLIIQEFGLFWSAFDSNWISVHTNAISVDFNIAFLIFDLIGFRPAWSLGRLWSMEWRSFTTMKGLKSALAKL